MAWTPGRWPLTEGDPIDTRYIDELRTELNARHGSDVIADAFVDGERTWSVIEELRDAVESVLDDFYKEDDWASYVGCGVAGSGSGVGETVNIFLDVFGGARDAWLNTPPATQATGPDYEPTDCDDPWKSYLNELHSVIDILRWRYVQAPVYEDGSGNHRLQKYDGWTSQNFVSRLGAVQDARDHAIALAATPTDSEYSYQFLDYAWNEWIPEWYAKAYFARTFFSFTLPADIFACKIYIPGVEHNWYAKDVDGNRVVTVNPAWSATFYISSVSPGTLAAADWDFGALGATVSCPNVIGPDFDPSVVATLSNFTADALNYLQLRLDETLPQHVVDSGWWQAGLERMEKDLPAHVVTAFVCVFFKVAE